MGSGDTLIGATDTLALPPSASDSESARPADANPKEPKEP